jgi:transposase
MRGKLGLFVGGADRARLAAIVADGNRPQKHVWRAKVVLLSADRFGTAEIMRRTGLSKPSVWRWQERYLEAGVDGLLRDKTRPSRVPPLDQGKVAEVIRRTLEEAPPGEATHWTVRAMAWASGVSPAKVHQIWQATGLAPHRVRRFKLSNDPAFAAKVEDVIGLYVAPPKHAIVLSIDEKAQIQALDRTQPGLPMKPGRLGTMTHDYKRNGTTTLFAALNVLDGRPVYAAPPPPGVPPLPQHDRAPGPGRQGDPRDPRQLRRAQAPERAQMAGAPPALDLPLHANLVLVAERRRGLLRQAEPAPPQARHLPLPGQPARGHQALHRTSQPGAHPIRLESRSQSHHCRRQTRAPNVADNPLVLTSISESAMLVVVAWRSRRRRRSR